MAKALNISSFGAGVKIYFAGSVRAGRADQEIYSKIINHLKGYGEVLTEHLGNKELTDEGEGIAESDIYQRDVAFLKMADVLVAEVSTASLGVGYEIAKAEEWGKRVLCLYKKFDDGRKISAMLKGSPYLTLKEYKDFTEACGHIDEFLRERT